MKALTGRSFDLVGGVVRYASDASSVVHSFRELKK